MHRLFRRALSIAVSTVLACNLTACTTKSGTRLSTDSVALQSIKSLHLAVTKSEPYTIVESNAATGSMVGGMAFGLAGALVGAGIDAARSSSKSTGLEDAVAPYLKDFNATALLASRTQASLIDSGRFDKVDLVTLPVSAPADGTIALNIETWGLRSCVGGASTEHMQVELHIDGKLTHHKDHRTIWERSEVYRDALCSPFSEFRDQPNLLRERLTQSIETVAGSLVNRILYPE